MQEKIDAVTHAKLQRSVLEIRKNFLDEQLDCLSIARSELEFARGNRTGDSKMDTLLLRAAELYVMEVEMSVARFEALVQVSELAARRLEDK